MSSSNKNSGQDPLIKIVTKSNMNIWKNTFPPLPSSFFPFNKFGLLSIERKESPLVVATKYEFSTFFPNVDEFGLGIYSQGPRT